MKKIFDIHVLTALVMFMLLSYVSKAQSSSSDDADFKPHGKLWGYAFGDYAYKGGADEAGRGGSNQYTKVPLNNSQFQFRRIYLGYNYDITKRLQAEFLLAAEDDFNGNLGQGTGDVLSNGKFSPYVKLANLRWKNLWKGTDFLFGFIPTPTFAQGAALKENARNSQTPEEVWGYRSVERTITDIRRTSSYDLGIALQGWIDKKGNYGYDVMVANGTGAKPETDAYKWFYGDLYAKFANKRLIIDLYADYNRIQWNPITDGQAETKTVSGTTTTYSLPSPAGLHHDRQMDKIFVAWQDKKFTVGVEYFMNTLMGDVAMVGSDHKVYYRTTKATGLTVFVKGAIYKDKLGFFARMDIYDPTKNIASIASTPGILSYSALTSQYEPTNKEQFVTLGLDFTPTKTLHVIPNIWLNTYKSELDATGKNTDGTAYSKLNSNVSNIMGSDIVYRLTFYYIYGK
jgi:hypothetical protein